MLFGNSSELPKNLPMETPSSTARRVARSQTARNSNLNNTIPMSRKIEDSEKGLSKARAVTGKQQQDRSALIDITNDSPIVGLAMGNLETPSSAVSKKRISNQLMHMKTPCSGESLLRGQVKTLLQKVEEEAEISKISLENKQFLSFQGFVSSPITLPAPTPANTPQIGNLLDTESFKKGCLSAVTPSPVQEQLMISQMVNGIIEGTKQVGYSESEKNLITRSLLFQSEGSDMSDCSSVLSNGGDNNNQHQKKVASDDDDSSVWSIQVNTSSRDDQEEEEFGDDIGEDEEEDGDSYDHEEEEGEEEEEEDGGLVDELCEGISKISVNGKIKVAKFSGKYTRFVYNSDGEIEGEEECGRSENGGSPRILRLKGLPAPKGKHLRFPEDDLEEEH